MFRLKHGSVTHCPFLGNHHNRPTDMRPEREVLPQIILNLETLLLLMTKKVVILECYK